VALVLLATFAIGGYMGSAPAQAGVQPAVSTAVAMQTGNVFSPSTVVIFAGGTVMWTNQDAMTHTTTSDVGAWDSGDVGPGKTFSVTLNVPGTYTYHCKYHAILQGATWVGMVGTVVVQAPPTNTPTAANTSTPTPVPTNTITPTATSTSTPAPTSTITPTATSTVTPTATSMITPTATSTAAPTSVPTATATPQGTRPGNGCGDKNHRHTGPPGRHGGSDPCAKGNTHQGQGSQHGRRWVVLRAWGAGAISGTAWVTVDARTGVTTVSFSVSHLRPRSLHAVFIRLGRCGGSGRVLYVVRSMRASRSGIGVMTVRVRSALMVGRWSISVARGSAQLRAIVACGDM
jgi:plastocyanin